MCEKNARLLQAIKSEEKEILLMFFLWKAGVCESACVHGCVG